MRRPTIAGVTPSSRAAAERLPRCATSTKVVSSLKRSTSGDAGFGRLTVGVVARAHERRAGRVRESHGERLFLVAAEFVGMRIALHRQVVARRLQVLADGEHLD